MTKASSATHSDFTATIASTSWKNNNIKSIHTLDGYGLQDNADDSYDGCVADLQVYEVADDDDLQGE